MKYVKWVVISAAAVLQEHVVDRLLCKLSNWVAESVWWEAGRCERCSEIAAKKWGSDHEGVYHGCLGDGCKEFDSFVKTYEGWS